MIQVDFQKYCWQKRLIFKMLRLWIVSSRRRLAVDYFIMKTDRRLRLLPQIQFSKEGIGTNVMKQSIAYVKEYTGRCIDYPDYLEKPYPLIADKYRKILQKYQQDMIFNG